MRGQFALRQPETSLGSTYQHQEEELAPREKEKGTSRRMRRQMTEAPRDETVVKAPGAKEAWVHSGFHEFYETHTFTYRFQHLNSLTIFHMHEHSHEHASRQFMYLMTRNAIFPYFGLGHVCGLFCNAMPTLRTALTCLCSA